MEATASMAEVDATESQAAVETQEDMVARHAAEIQAIDDDLQEKLSHVGKKNRKKKKALWAEADQLKADAQERHRTELLDAGYGDVVEAADVAAENAAAAAAETEDAKPKKKSKSQRRREKKAAEERERAEQLRREAAGFVSGRDVEMKQLGQILQRSGLKVHDIAADGHCLYRAVAHQLSMVAASQPTSHSELRSQAAAHMIAHRQDYEPFYDADAGGANFDDYCATMASSARWGGQLELRALSELLKRPIRVFGAAGPVADMGSQFSDDGRRKPILLSFHQQYYALGEHYNSVVPA